MMVTRSGGSSLALMLLLAAGCASEVTLKPVHGSFFFPPRGELNKEQRYVVRTQSEWRRQWERMSSRLHHNGGWPIPDRGPLPAIDFTREMVLIAELGLKGSGGFDVDIARVIDRGSFIEVEVRQFSPGPRCRVAADNETPTDVVRVSASSKPVRWRVDSQVRDC